MEKTKKFDCIALKRRGAEKIYKRLAKMSQEEQLAFWQARTLALRQRRQQLKKSRSVESLPT